MCNNNLEVTPLPKDRFLLIKPYSQSLWMDVHQIIDYLLVAELTNRIPVVYCGSKHLHRGTVNTNAFDMYFQPISSATIENLMKPEYTFFPTVWKYDNMMNDDPDRGTLLQRNIGDLFNSHANVVVCDTYINRFQLIPYILPEHPAYGISPQQIYRYLFKKYLRLKPDIKDEIKQFYKANLKNQGPVLGVHVRGSFEIKEFNDEFHKRFHSKVFKLRRREELNVNETIKLHEIPRIHKFKNLQLANDLYHKEIQWFLGKFSIKKIFLATESEEVLEEYRRIYGPILTYTDALRSPKDDQEALYKTTHMHKRYRGIDIIKDTYLASKCDFFIGNGYSNLSHAVTRLNDWPSTNIKLMYWLQDKKSIHNYKQINSIIYPGNEFVGKFKQFLFKVSKAMNNND